MKRRKEGNILFNDALNDALITFYLRLLLDRRFDNGSRFGNESYDIIIFLFTIPQFVY